MATMRALLFRGLLLSVTAVVVADAAPLPRASHPFARAHKVDPHGARWAGTVLERVPAGPYLYLRVTRDDGEPAWVVTAEALAPDAARVRVHVMRRVDHFESPRLGRSFAPLSFAIVRKDT